MLLRIAATLALLVPLPATAEEACLTWQSLNGRTLLHFDDARGRALTLVSEDTGTQRCGGMIGAMGYTALWATCGEDTETYHPLFFAPVDPEDPEGEAILIFGPEAFYSTCN